MNFPHYLQKSWSRLGCVFSKEHQPNGAPPAHHTYYLKYLLVTTVTIKCNMIWHWWWNWIWRETPSLLYNRQTSTRHVNLPLYVPQHLFQWDKLFGNKRHTEFIQRHRLITFWNHTLMGWKQICLWGHKCGLNLQDGSKTFSLAGAEELPNMGIISLGLFSGTVVTLCKLLCLHKQATLQ